jgi:hypothetical protein
MEILERSRSGLKPDSLKTRPASIHIKSTVKIVYYIQQQATQHFKQNNEREPENNDIKTSGSRKLKK